MFVIYLNLEDDSFYVKDLSLLPLEDMNTLDRIKEIKKHAKRDNDTYERYNTPEAVERRKKELINLSFRMED